MPADRTNPPVTLDMPAPADVKAILKASCYDCHSNETVWPWYSRIAPISWLVASDTSKGREYLNFSTWDQYSPEQQRESVTQFLKMVQKGEMPPRPYTILHAEGKITPEKLAILEAWAATATP
jgi:hypothetical protein